MPNADVLLPLPWPVRTITSGRSRRLRRSGSALPASPGLCGTSTSSPPWRASCSGICGSVMRPSSASRVRRRRVQPRAGGAGQPLGEPEPHRAVLDVDDVHGVGRAPEPRGGAAHARRPDRRRARRSGSPRSRAGRGRGPTRAGSPARPARGRRRAACGRRSGSSRMASAACSSGRARRDEQLRVAAAEGDHGDAVAARVGLAQRGEQRALDARQAAARAHRAARVHDEAQQHALAAAADVLAQARGVALDAGARAASPRSRRRRARPPRAGCRWRRRPSPALRARRPPGPLPVPASAQRLGAAGARAPARRGARARGRRARPPSARRRLGVARRRSGGGPPRGAGSGGSGGGCVVERAVDVVGRGRLGPSSGSRRRRCSSASARGARARAPRSPRRRRPARPARAPRARSRCRRGRRRRRAAAQARGDAQQLALGQAHGAAAARGRRRCARASASSRRLPLARRTPAGSRSKASRRRTISARTAGSRGPAHLDAEAEAVEQLRAQLALLDVHRADEQEARVVHAPTPRRARRATTPEAAASSSASTRWSGSRLTSST